MRIVVLDIVRFVAALSVVCYHYISRHGSNAFPLMDEFTKYGYLGVPLFFIISGYVIALSADNRTCMQFGVSRFVRLYPALWIGIIFTVTIVTLFTDKQYSLLQVLANCTLLNEYLGFQDVDVVYWTLKVELKFYACIFLLLLFGVFHRYRSWLSIWLALTVLHAVSGQPFFMGWFISPAYSSFFIAGIAFFLIQKNGRNIFSVLVVVLSLVLSSVKIFGQADLFLPEPGVVEKIISVLAVWGFYFFFYFISNDKINLDPKKIFLTIGALTYPLYLIHNMAGKAIIDHYSSIVPERILIILVIIFMIVASYLIYRFVERPLASRLKVFLLFFSQAVVERKVFWASRCIKLCVRSSEERNPSLDRPDRE